MNKLTKLRTTSETKAILEQFLESDFGSLLDFSP